MLTVIDLDFDYQDEPLLKQVNFHLPAGGLLHLRGANGTGKTTLLKLIAGLYRPNQGQIQFLKQSIYNNLTQYHGTLCYIGHKSGINPYLTLRENCQFDADFREKSSKIEEIASIFDLEPSLDKLCGLLSAGQKRKAALLRLWVTKATLWLLDEPLVALDDKAQQSLLLQMNKHCQQGGAIILTSHQSLPLDSTHYKEYEL